MGYRWKGKRWISDEEADAEFFENLGILGSLIKWIFLPIVATIAFIILLQNFCGLVGVDEGKYREANPGISWIELIAWLIYVVFFFRKLFWTFSITILSVVLMLVLSAHLNPPSKKHQIHSMDSQSIPNK
jgi:hypothetical protein